MRTRLAGAHEELAVLLARAGLLDDAERELGLAEAADPQSSSVKRLHESLRARQRR